MPWEMQAHHTRGNVSMAGEERDAEAVWGVGPGYESHTCREVSRHAKVGRVYL